MKNKYITSIYISDTKIGIYAYNQKTFEPKTSFVDLEPNIIDQGYIKSPLTFSHLFLNAFKSLGKVSKHVQWIIQDQNILIREVQIAKDNMNNLELDEYIKKEMGKSIKHPFNIAVYTYKVRHEDDIQYILTIYLCDQNLIENYLDIFEYSGIRKIELHLTSTILSHAYDIQDNEHVLIVIVDEQLITMSVLENKSPIFSTLYEYELGEEANNKYLANYIEIVTHYYQYNLRNNKQAIDKLIICDSTNNEIVYHDLKQLCMEICHDFNIIFINDKTYDEDEKIPNIINLLNLAALTYQNYDYKPVNYVVKRITKQHLHLRYLVVYAVFLLAMIGFVITPGYFLFRDIALEESILEALEVDDMMLEDAINDKYIFNDYEIDYNLTYDDLSSYTFDEVTYVQDLLSIDKDHVDFISLDLMSKDHKITITFSSDDKARLYNYLNHLYEDQINNWLRSYPEYRFISEYVMEVVVYYD